MDFPTFNSIPYSNDHDKKDSKPSVEKSIRKTYGSENRRERAASQDSKNNTGEQMVKFQDFYTID